MNNVLPGRPGPLGTNQFIPPIMKTLALLDPADLRALQQMATDDLMGAVLRLNLQPRYHNGLDVIVLTILLLEQRSTPTDVQMVEVPVSSTEFPVPSSPMGQSGSIKVPLPHDHWSQADHFGEGPLSVYPCIR